jgi:hypothetical protein
MESSTATLPLKLWIRLRNQPPVLIPAGRCEDVYDFMDAVKKEVSVGPSSVAVTRVTLHTSENEEALRPELALTELGEAGQSAEKALIVETVTGNVRLQLDSAVPNADGCLP